jgi:nucleotide-binding universal stress UspA family protein
MAGSDISPLQAGTVVAATDLSETASAAVRWAIEIARQRRSQLHLVHALNLAGWTLDFSELASRVPVQLEDAARQHLERIALESRQRGIAVSWEVTIGQPSEIIVDAARRLRAELIVLGSRGHRPLDHVFLGSTAERVVQQSTGGVLTVHSGDPAPTDRVRRILSATDFSDEATWALRSALRLLTADGVTPPSVILLHAYHVPYEFSIDSIYGPAALDASALDAVAKEVDARLARQAAVLEAELGIEVITSSRSGFPPHVIAQQAAETNADLIVMGTHGRTGLAHVLLGSNAERVIQQAPCPVLTVRKSKAESTASDSEGR